MDSVERMQSLLLYANAAKVARGLTERGYSVSPPTVSRWANGQGVTPLKVQLVETLLRDLLDMQKPAAPDWERLMRTVDAYELYGPGAPETCAELKALDDMASGF